MGSPEVDIIFALRFVIVRCVPISHVALLVATALCVLTGTTAGLRKAIPVRFGQGLWYQK